MDLGHDKFTSAPFMMEHRRLDILDRLKPDPVPEPYFYDQLGHILGTSNQSDRSKWSPIQLVLVHDEPRALIQQYRRLLPTLFSDTRLTQVFHPLI